MSRITEKDWTTRAGLRAVVLWVHDSHRCGYVGVPASHPLHGIDYSKASPHLEIADDTEVGKRGVIPLALYAMRDEEGQKEISPDIYFDVHGGLTYSGDTADYPAVAEGTWWFGFDCAHAGDATGHHHCPGDVLRSLEYVEAECESLAEQLARISA